MGFPPFAVLLFFALLNFAAVSRVIFPGSQIA
jgi:hypothetical protein